LQARILLGEAMPPMRSDLAALILIFLSILAPPVWADSYVSVAGLQCRGNAVAIRTGGGSDLFTWYELPLPYAAAWKDAPFVRDDRCTLGNGDKVVMRTGRGRAYSSGMGGGNPPQYVSLWINGRKVLSREVWKAGYSLQYDGPYLNSIFLSREAIERCAYPKGVHPTAGTPKDVVCVRTPLAYDALLVDPLEPTEAVAAGPRITFSAAYNPDFCRHFIGRMVDVNPSLEGLAAEEETVVLPPAAVFPFQRDKPDSKGPYVEAAKVDLWNNGKRDTIARVFLTTRWEERADYVFIKFGPVDADAVAKLSDKVEKLSRLDDPSKAIDPKQLETDGWFSPTKHLSDSMRVFVLDGVTYMLASHGDATDGLTATLYRPGQPEIGGIGGETEAICIFQRRKVNF
jgi:hypothetical protein